MDLTAPISYNGYTLGGLTPAAGGVSSVGSVINAIDVTDVDVDGMLLPRANTDGLFSSDVHLGGRRISIDAAVYGSTHGAAWSELDSLLAAFHPRLAHDADPDNLGFLPLKFQQSTTSSNGSGYWLYFDQYILDLNPIAYWDFWYYGSVATNHAGYIVTDRTTNLLHGVPHGPPWIGPNGDVGHAGYIWFQSSSSQYVAFPSTSSFDATHDLTLSVFYYKTGGNPASEQTIFSHSNSAAVNKGYALRVTSGGLPKIEIGDGTTGISITAGSASLADGLLHHIVVTRSSAAVAMYVDGSSIYSSPTTAGGIGSMSGAGTIPTALGAWLASGTTPVAGTYLDGYIESVGVWLTALSATQVSGIYHAATDDVRTVGSPYMPLQYYARPLRPPRFDVALGIGASTQSSTAPPIERKGLSIPVHIDMICRDPRKYLQHPMNIAVPTTSSLLDFSVQYPSRGDYNSWPIIQWTQTATGSASTIFMRYGSLDSSSAVGSKITINLSAESSGTWVLDYEARQLTKNGDPRNDLMTIDISTATAAPWINNIAPWWEIHDHYVDDFTGMSNYIGGQNLTGMTPPTMIFREAWT